MDDFRPIARIARYLWGLSGVGVIVVVGLLLAIALMIVSGTAIGLGVIVVAVLLAGWWWWISGRRWRSWGYAEKERDLLIRRGVMVRHLTVVPYGRMQFIEVRQGPLDRTLGTASLQLHTAAAATDASIPLLKLDEADRLRERLTDLGEAHAAGL